MGLQGRDDRGRKGRVGGQAWGMGSKVAAYRCSCICSHSSKQQAANKTCLRTRMAHDLRVNGPDLHGAVH